MANSIPTRAAIEAELLWRSQHRIESFYPDSGPLRRGLYLKHLEFFRAGASHNERCLLGGNRSGKTFAGSYEVACHLLGTYPSWWEGRRFTRPISVFAAGKDGRTTRDILQVATLGPGLNYGTGMLPADSIVRTTTRPGTPDAVETCWVKHSSGGTSELSFKSFDAGAESFFGVRKDVVWLDEEPPLSV